MRRILLLLLAVYSLAAQAQWPGQPGNAVGYAAAPGWPGSFTTTACPSSPASGSSWATATVVSNCTYSTASHITVSGSYIIYEYVDFKSSSNTDNTALITGTNLLFLGDRFQSNCWQCANVSITSTASSIYLFYDTVSPLASLYTSPPGYSTWPSAGAGANSTSVSDGVNQCQGSNGYEYGYNLNNSVGTVWIDHNEIWCFGDAIVAQTSTAQITITDNWMHDTTFSSASENHGTTGYHQDGFGYSNGAVAPNNILMVGNATAFLGNTNSLALQAATGGYQNIYVNHNFFTGDNATISWCQPGSVQCTNSTFYGNVWGATVAASGPIYSPGSALGTGSVWACNTVSIPSGTTWSELNSPFWAPSHTQDGQYFLNTDPPNSTTDQSGNTHCGIPAPSSINFGNQATSTTSGGQTITFSSTNTANLSISSIALATGTQFSIASNTCGATLNSGSNCSITIKFAPTSLGPQTDTLQITDNTPGVSSPQLVPLAGIGCTAGPNCPSSPPPSTVAPCFACSLLYSMAVLP